MSRSSRNSEKRSSRNDFYRGDNNKTERRTLFNPQSDNPLAFNAKPDDNYTISSNSSNSTNQRSYSAQRRRQGLEQQQQRSTSSSGIRPPASSDSLFDERSSRSSPGRPSRGVLWDPNNKPIPQRIQPPTPPPSTPQQQKTSQQQPQSDVNTTPATTTTSDRSSKNTKKGPGNDSAATMTPEEQEHRMKLKTFLARIQKLQAKITQVDDTTSVDHPYFHGISLDANGNNNSSNKTDSRRQRQRRHVDNNNNDDDDAFLYDRQQQSPPPLDDHHATHPWLTMTLESPLWQSTEQIWKDKMQLHLQLANAYLDVIQYDDGFAETNHLTSLCWKRAIYSLVEQFRQAFARQQALAVAVAASAAAEEGDDGPKQKTATRLVMDDSDMDDDDDDDDDFVPVMTENGMTMVPLLSDSDQDDDDNEMDKASLQNIMDKHLRMLRTWMDIFLVVADDYYQRAMVVLLDLEKDTHDGSDTLETSLHSWRRTRRWKWYRCIPYRGDLARYRFIYGQNKGDYALAWRWYSLGVWMIPATGRFYFHQSLLLNSPQYSPLYEFHKLYFGVRSLVVRRNGFVNAREGLVTLFENSRQWRTATMNGNSNNKMRRRQRQRRQPKDKETLVVEPADKMIAGLFICLHGMLFTKINLDAFTQTKRHYFETLFPSTLTSPVAPSTTDPQQQLSSTTTLSCQHLFWLETILLNLSSLYSYDYASSTLTKALTLNKTYWIANNEEIDDDDDDDGGGGKSSKQQHDNWQDVLETLDDSPLFSHSIDLICQVAVELLSRFMNNDSALITSPALPALPPVILNLKANESLLFGTTSDATTPVNDDATDMENVENQQQQQQPWLIYIYVLLHWMVVTGIGVTCGDGNNKSIWETVIGQVATKTTGATSNNMDKITRTFWPLLMTFLTRLLHDLPENQRYQVIDRHLLDSSNPWATDEEQRYERGAWDDYIMRLMGPCPVLPEDESLRGLGWLDQALAGSNNNAQLDTPPATDMDLQRRIRILDYGFTLVKQMHQTLEYDPVEEAFLVKLPPSPLVEEEQEPESVMMVNDNDDADLLPILTAMDDAVLFDTTNGSVDEGTLQDDDDDDGAAVNGDDTHIDDDDELDDDADDDMMGQLKKRRQHLQTMLATITAEKQHAATYGYQKLTMQRRGKEREERLNRIREKVIPGQTMLVLDTNCFIGHMDAIRRLIQGGAWSIVIPLVVITELDGLKGNAAPLGTVADQALQLIETALATKQHRPDAIRIQTSHHNFMYDISIRSEQFIFGETDKNLDDLILSTCLWWNNNNNNKKQTVGVPVCLVTADRNLSLKARARDVQVIPVSGLMKIHPPPPFPPL